MKQKIVEMDSIRKSYNSIDYVLDDLCLTISGGEIITIQGASGSGKSTLLNIMGLLDGFNSGTYCINGTSVTSNERRKRMVRASEIGFIFQSYALIESLSVQDNILMPYLYTGKMDNGLIDQLEQLLDELGIAKIRKQKAKNLSGGEKQRVAVARALLKKPTLIIADEPTGNLDEENAKIINNIFLKHLTDRCAVTIVTHNPHIFTDVTHSYMLREGKLWDI